MSYSLKGIAMEDFLNFKKMITPLIIKVLFWVGVALAIVGGLIAVVGGATADYGGGPAVLMGLVWIFLGPLIVRIYCELLIVIFSVNDTLTEIRDILKDK